MLAFLLSSGNATGVASAASRAAQDEHLKVPKGEIVVKFPAATLPVRREVLIESVKTAAHAVSNYYGRFPVRHLTVDIKLRDTSHPLFASEHLGESIRVQLGTTATAAHLEHNWVMTHEMVHLAFPDLEQRYSWIEEGLATYLEPIARAQVGQIPVEDVWSDLVERLPEGFPHAGSGGLNDGGNYARIYWGGALYWFLADLEIREETHNKKGIQDVLVGVLNRGGDGSRHWEVEKFLKVAKEIIGLDTFRELYLRLGSKPETVELKGIWEKLGVSKVGKKWVFDDKAPLASIRRSMTGAEKATGVPPTNRTARP